MRILVVGGGGREHALCRKLSESSLVDKVYAAPGNPGTQNLPKTENVAVGGADITDIFALQKFAQTVKIDLTIVGQEKFLAHGIANYFQDDNLSIFAPTMEAAQIETSKAFAKRFCKRHGIPTTPSGVFQLYSHAIQTMFRHWRNEKEEPPPLVIKADGLAEGKGTYICRSEQEAQATLRTLMLEKKYGRAGERVVIEEFLSGREASLHAFTDGKTTIPLVCARDYKALFPANPEKNQPPGPNTGGMGAYAPIPWINSQKELDLHKTFTDPILDCLQREGMPFSGCIYPGVMIQDNGDVLLECNARMGDPETQVIVNQINGDLAELFLAYKEGRMNSVKVAWKDGYSVCVVLVSSGYPETPKKLGVPIYGIEDAVKIPGISVFHAGTRYEGNQLITAGGRVLGVTARAETFLDAVSRAYQAVDRIHFEGMFYRRDIGSAE